MLQIISGKFFSGTGKVNERAADAILYSNYSWVAPVITAVAELRPVSSYQSIASYVVRYTNRYEPADNDVVVLASGNEAVDQFRLLLSIWFRAFFHADRLHVESLCRTAPRHEGEAVIPSRLIDGHFSHSRAGNFAEVTKFPDFVNKVLGMPRKSYNLFMSCLGAYFDALEAIDTNFDLAYSIFVYILEALSKAQDEYQPTWTNYDQSVRDRLDAELTAISSERADAIRNILIGSSHQKLMARFLAFVQCSVRDSFFREEAASVAHALPKSDLQQALKNLYITRSGFVHQLREAHEQIRRAMPGWDSVQWGNELYLTIGGLARLCRHVLLTFVEQQPVLVREEFQWQSELPGFTMGRLHWDYWIWRGETYTAENAAHRLGGFFHAVLETYQQPTKPLTDMAAVLARIEVLAPQESVERRLTMLVLYELWHSIINDEGKRPEYERFLQKYVTEKNRCSAATYAAHVVCRSPPPWPAAECEAALEEYLRVKYKPKSLQVPLLLDLAMKAELANRFLAEGLTTKYTEWMQRANLDAAGHPAIQQHLDICLRDNQSVDCSVVLGCPQPAPDEQPKSEESPPET